MVLADVVSMPKEIYLIFIAISVLAAILLLVLILVGFMTPAMIFLKAKFKKASLIYEVNRAQQGRFLIANTKHQGIADAKGVGPYLISDGSHTIEAKSKLTFYFGFGEFGATLPLKYAYIIQKLRESGYKITNVDDLGKLIGLEFDDTRKAWVQKKEEDMSDDEKKTMLDLQVAIQPFETIKIHDLAFMFPFNITPALMESKTQHMIGLKMGMFNKMNMQYVLMFIMILMGVTLAAVIAFKFIKSGDTTEITRIIETVIQTVPSGNISLTG